MSTLLVLMSCASLASCGNNTDSSNSEEPSVDNPISEEIVDSANGGVEDSANDTPDSTVGEDSTDSSDSSEESIESTPVENVVTINVPNQEINANYKQKVDLNLASATSSIHGDVTAKIKVKIAVGENVIVPLTDQANVTNFLIESKDDYTVTYRVDDEGTVVEETMNINVNYVTVDGDIEDDIYDITYKTGMNKEVTVKAHANEEGVYFGVSIPDNDICLKAPTQFANYDQGDYFDIYFNPSDSDTNTNLSRIRMNAYDMDGLVMAMKYDGAQNKFIPDIAKTIAPVEQALAMIGESSVTVDAGSDETKSDVDEGWVNEFFYSWISLGLDEAPTESGIGFRRKDFNQNGVVNEYNHWKESGESMGSTVSDYGTLTYTGENKGIVWKLNEHVQSYFNYFENDNLDPENPAIVANVNKFFVDPCTAPSANSASSIGYFDEDVAGNFSFKYKIYNASIIESIKNNGVVRGVNFVISRDDGKFDIFRVDLTSATKGKPHIINAKYSFGSGIESLENIDYSTFDVHSKVGKLAVKPSMGHVEFTRTVSETGSTYTVVANQPLGEPTINLSYTSDYTGAIKVGFAIDNLNVTGPVLYYMDFIEE